MDNILKVHLPVEQPSFNSDLLHYYEKEVREKGLVVLKDVFSNKHLDELTGDFDNNWDEVQEKISSLKKRPGIYLNSGRPKTYSNQPLWTLEDGSPVLDLAKGRLDFIYGMDKGGFADDRFFNQPLVSALVWRLLKCDWSHYNGALPSYSSSTEGSSEFGPWHRDTYSLFGCEEMDHSLPPFYLTMIVPLQEVTEDMGPTEFVVGSHREGWVTALQTGGLEHVLATSKRGDCLIFDGRMIHRGTPCKSSSPRKAVYTVFHKKWYSDYIDGQYPEPANKHGLPRNAVLPSGFQVPLDISHPTQQAPAWSFSISAPVCRGDIVWKAGLGDSLVFENEELLAHYKETLSSLEAQEVGKMTYKTQEGKYVLRKDWSSLLPEVTDGCIANISVDENGDWIATKNIDKNSNIFLDSKSICL